MKNIGFTRTYYYAGYTFSRIIISTRSLPRVHGRAPVSSSHSSPALLLLARLPLPKVPETASEILKWGLFHFHGEAVGPERAISG